VVEQSLSHRNRLFDRDFGPIAGIPVSHYSPTIDIRAVVNATTIFNTYYFTGSLAIQQMMMMLCTLRELLPGPEATIPVAEIPSDQSRDSFPA
jgi:hypothetical protein